MRKVLSVCAALALMGVSAQAADVLVKKAPQRSAAPVWSWTGFYLGGHLGGAWGRSDWFEDASESGGGFNPGFQDAAIGASSLIGGGQVGADYQSGWAVFGVQADADLANLNATQGTCFPELVAQGFQNSCTVHIDTMGTVTGRIGAAFDRTLLYALAGLAWEHEHLDNVCVGCGGLSGSMTTRNGWTFGAGLEYALLGNWSVFVQYNYMRFGTRDLQFSLVPSGAPDFTENIRDQINVIKAGINYRLDWGTGR
jgi:outer membrane immunogenic protein